jgi:DNA topoisomerase-1
MADGTPVTDFETLRRIQSLVIPPAWKDVWICPWPNGHIQAVGTDAAGRRQYRYHDDWRIRRDQQKFERVESFGRCLPELRKIVDRDLGGEGLTRERVLAAVVRLLDIGCFRIGNDAYADEHDTFGVSTLHREHVRISKATMHFDYPAKGSIQRQVDVSDPQVCAVVSDLRRRRRDGDRLFAYRDGRRWVEIGASDVNDYIKAAAGGGFSAKDFRTWSATVLAAVALAVAEVPGTRTGRRRAENAAVKEVAAQLGNTPTVCRSSYIDPRVIDRFEGGQTIDVAAAIAGPETLASAPPRRRRAVEEAVIDLLAG